MGLLVSGGWNTIVGFWLRLGENYLVFLGPINNKALIPKKGHIATIIS